MSKTDNLYKRLESAKVMLILLASHWLLLLGYSALILIGVGLISMETHNIMIEIALAVSTIHMVVLAVLDPIAARIASRRKGGTDVREQSMAKKTTLPKRFFTVAGVVLGLTSGIFGGLVVNTETYMHIEMYDNVVPMVVISWIVVLVYAFGYSAIGIIMDRRKNRVAETKVQVQAQEKVKPCTPNDEYISCDPSIALRKEIVNTWKDCGFEAYCHGKRVCLDGLCLDDFNYKIDHEAKKVYLWESKE